MPQPTIAAEIERYLRTGDADTEARAWPGDIIDRGQRQHADLRGALVREVRRLAKGRSHVPVPADIGVDFTRAKVEPMVRPVSARGSGQGGGGGASSRPPPRPRSGPCATMQTK